MYFIAPRKANAGLDKAKMIMIELLEILFQFKAGTKYPSWTAELQIPVMHV